MKKLLFILNADWYFNLHWKDRAKHAVKNGFEVHLIVHRCSTELYQKFNDLNINVHQFSLERTGVNFFKEIKSLFALKRLIKKINPDIIHSVTIKPNLYATILCFFSRTNLVSTYAGLGTLKISETLVHKIISSVIFNLIRIFSSGKKNIALFENQDDLDFFQNTRIIDKERLFRVFGAGVDINEYSYSEESGQSEVIKILFASRLLKNKGLELLIESTKQLKADGLNIQLDVAGIFDFDSPFAFTESEIFYFREHGLINWLGKRDDIPSLITNSSIVSLPTTYGEGVPRILIEACCIGRPIITTPLGGCKDICIDSVNGFLVAPNSVEQLTEAIRKLSDYRKLRIDFGFKGRKLVEEKFSNKHILRQNLHFYNGFK
jgi:glycosyltransferase involved in cell wall biosynthesis